MELGFALYASFTIGKAARAPSMHLLTARLGLGSAESAVDNHLRGRKARQRGRPPPAAARVVVRCAGRESASEQVALSHRPRRRRTRSAERVKRSTTRIVEAHDTRRPQPRRAASPAGNRIAQRSAAWTVPSKHTRADSALEPRPAHSQHEVAIISSARVDEKQHRLRASAAMSSDLARAIFSRLPSSSMWLSPTLGDNSPSRAHEGTQRIELAAAAHAHLNHNVESVGIGGKQRVRHAELIVLVAAA